MEGRSGDNEPTLFIGFGAEDDIGNLALSEWNVLLFGRSYGLKLNGGENFEDILEEAVLREKLLFRLIGNIRVSNLGYIDELDVVDGEYRATLDFPVGFSKEGIIKRLIDTGYCVIRKNDSLTPSTKLETYWERSVSIYELRLPVEDFEEVIELIR